MKCENRCSLAYYFLQWFGGVNKFMHDLAWQWQGKAQCRTEVAIKHCTWGHPDKSRRCGSYVNPSELIPEEQEAGHEKMAEREDQE